jgi:hypothetical protein
MSASPITTTVPLPGSRAPKLRSSCNSCGIAKVKCDRNQPECGRCATVGLACVYGLSRQFGKPPRKRPATDLEVTTRYKKRAAHINDSRNHHAALGYTEHPSLHESGQMRLSKSATDIASLPSTYGPTNTLRMNENNHFNSTLFTSLFLDEWPQLDSFGVNLETSSVPKIARTEDQHLTCTFEPINAARMESVSRQSHSCPRESYEILRDLICPSPNLHAPEADSDPVMAQLDQVLRCTRNAIDRLTRLLKYPCGRSGHRVMVHASIISRILLWYQQAAGWICNDSWPRRPFAPVNSPTSSSASPSSPPLYETEINTDSTNTPTLAQSTGFVVENVPVSMGTFSIEDQNVQATLRNQLILSELKRATGLIDLFKSQDSCESSANRTAGLHAHLGAWLRGEHSRIVEVLTTRLSAMNENLNLR